MGHCTLTNHQAFSSTVQKISDMTAELITISLVFNPFVCQAQGPISTITKKHLDGLKNKEQIFLLIAQSQVLQTLNNFTIYIKKYKRTYIKIYYIFK